MDTQKGFTLIEMVIATMLILLIMAAMSTLFCASSQLIGASDCQREAQQTTRFAIDTIVREVKYSQKILLISESCVILETPQKKITYFLDPNQKILRRDKNDGSGAQPLTGGSIIPLEITYLRFNALDETSSGAIHTLQITITATSTDNWGKKYNYTLQTAVTHLNQ